MAHLTKIVILAVIAVIICLQSFTNAKPRPSHAKIRIHVPVKHHTHFHTKTLVKTVHVPIKTATHHHYEEELDDGAWGKSRSWAKSYAKKKKSRSRPARYRN